MSLNTLIYILLTVSVW